LKNASAMPIGKTALAGPLADLGFEVRLAHYRFDVRRHDSNSHTTTWEPHPFTVCVAELVFRYYS